MNDSFYRGRKVVVTGGSGFIGSHIVDELLANDVARVTIVDVNEPRYAPLDDARVRFMRGDVRDGDVMLEAVGGADVIFHHGAIASVPDCSERPADAYSVNTSALAVLAQSASKAAPNAAILFASSAAVYGASAQRTKNAESAPKSPHSIYGSSKALGEDILSMFNRVYGIRATIVRYANIYGPRQPRYIVYDMYHKVRRAIDTLDVLGSGLQERDFVYVSDAVRLTLAAAATTSEKIRIFNIGTGTPTTVLDIAGTVAEVMGRGSLALKTTGESWVGDVDYLLVDASHTERVLGEAHVPLDEGLRKTIAWFVEHDAARA